MVVRTGDASSVSSVVAPLPGSVACRKSLRSDLSIIVSMSNAASVRPRRMAFLVSDIFIF